MRIYFPVLLALVLLCACDNPPPRDAASVAETDTLSADTSRAELPTATVDTTSTNDDRVVEDGWTLDRQSAETDPSGIATARDIRVATHEDYDRIVVEFEGDVLPSYSVQYADDPVSECGSGTPVVLDGSEVLEIRMTPARGHTDEGKSLVSHFRQTPGLPAVVEFDVPCDFEANFSVAAGISGRHMFRAQVFRDPLRLVVDVRHP